MTGQARRHFKSANRHAPGALGALGNVDEIERERLVYTPLEIKGAKCAKYFVLGETWRC
jgi:hypothetical protein